MATTIKNLTAEVHWLGHSVFRQPGKHRRQTTMSRSTQTTTFQETAPSTNSLWFAGN